MRKARPNPAPVSDMKILLLSYGPADYSIEYANAVAACGETTMFAPRRTMAHLEAFADPRLRLRLFDWPRQSSPAIIAAMAGAARAIRALDPDIVHNLNEAFVWARLLRALTRRYPMVTTVHDLAYRPGEPISRRIPRWMVDLNVRESDAVVIHGHALRDAAVHALGVPPERIHELPHLALMRYRGISERARLAPARDGRVRVLFFGHVHRYKGLGHLMEAARRVLAAAPEVRFVIAGTGDDLAPYRTGADPQRVTFIDRYVPDEEVAQLFLDADLVVLPYIAASQSGVLALAAAFSKPAIVTRVGGLPEVVEAGAMGLVVPPADPGALAAAILRLAGDPDERARLGRNAGRFAETTISHRTVGARALEIYRAVLAAR